MASSSSSSFSLPLLSYRTIVLIYGLSILMDPRPPFSSSPSLLVSASHSGHYATTTSPVHPPFFRRYHLNTQQPQQRLYRHTNKTKSRVTATAAAANSLLTSTNTDSTYASKTVPSLHNLLTQIRGGASKASITTTAAATTATTGNNKSGASFASSIFNLANNVAGAGLLTLAASKASGATGWIPSVFICVVLAMASARTFTLIGKCCEVTGERTFKGIWAQAFSSSSTYIVDSLIFIQCFLSSTIYVGLLGDIFSALLGNTSIPTQYTTRARVILTVAATILFPLNLIRDLSALAFTSVLGLCAVLYTVAFMIFRFLDGSYSTVTQPIGKFLLDGAILKPDFTKSTMWNVDLRSLMLVSNLGLAFIAHYNSPTYYREMKNDIRASFSRMVYCAYSILALIYVATMVAGYGTFGDAAKGNILLSYHPSDFGATLARVATGLSVVFGFPLVSNGAREGLKNAAAALGYPQLSQDNNHPKLAAGMLAAACVLAICVEDIKVIAGFSGAAMGSFLVYVCPAIIYLRILKKVYGKESSEYRRGFRWNAGFVPFGVFLGMMGVTMNYRSLMESSRKVAEVVGEATAATV